MLGATTGALSIGSPNGIDGRPPSVAVGINPPPDVGIEMGGAPVGVGVTMGDGVGVLCGGSAIGGGRVLVRSPVGTGGRQS